LNPEDSIAYTEGMIRSGPCLIAAAALLLAAGCAAPDLSKLGFQRVAVTAFRDAPGAPGSGELAAHVLRRELARKGFILREPSEAEAVLSGEVSEASVRREMVPATLEDEERVRTDGPTPELERIPVIVRHDDTDTASFSFSARLSGPEGALLWSGSASEEDEDGKLSIAAERAAMSAVSGLLRALLKSRAD